MSFPRSAGISNTAPPPPGPPAPLAPPAQHNELEMVIDVLFEANSRLHVKVDENTRQTKLEAERRVIDYMAANGLMYFKRGDKYVCLEEVTENVSLSPQIIFAVAKMFKEDINVREYFAPDTDPTVFANGFVQYMEKYLTVLRQNLTKRKLSVKNKPPPGLMLQQLVHQQF